MQNLKNDELEQVMAEALKLNEAGRPTSEIIKLFPQCAADLKEMFRTIDVLKLEKNNVEAPKVLLNKIIHATSERKQRVEDIKMKKIEAFAFKNQSRELSNASRFDKPGRPSALNNLLNIIQTMNMDKKIYVGICTILLVIIIAGGVYKMGRNNRPSPSALEQQITSNQKIFESDSADIEELGNDTILDDVKSGLADISSIEESGPVESKKIDSTLLDSIEKDLSGQLDNFSGDLTDLDSFSSDNSMGNINTELSGISG